MDLNQTLFTGNDNFLDKSTAPKLCNSTNASTDLHRLKVWFFLHVYVYTLMFFVLILIITPMELKKITASLGVEITTALDALYLLL